MPREINMEQNDDNEVILDDPFLGADPDEEVDDETVDLGNEVDTPAEDVDEDESGSSEGDDKDLDEESDDKDDKDKDDEETEEEDDDKPGEEDETEEDESGNESTEQEEDTPPAEKDQRIPKQRFDEVNERRKAAEQKLADYEAAQAAAKKAEEGAFDFDAAERNYMELVVDGEFEAAQKVRSEIRAAEKAENAALAVDQAEATREATKADLVFQDTVTELETAYPMLVDGNEGFDQGLVDEVLALHEGFLNQGLEAPTAIRKAVNYVAKMNDFTPAGEEAAPADAKPTKKPASKTDNQAKAKAKTEQPQKLPKEEEREPALDLNSMTEAEFDALPESKKRELRGDFI